jgi:hypothetical protein
MQQALARVCGQHARLAARAPAGDVPEAELEQLRVVVARGRGEHERGHRLGWDTAEPRRRGAQHQASDTLGRAVGQLLGEAAAERVAEHVHALQAEGVQQGGDHARKPFHPQRATRPLRESGAGRVEGDQLPLSGVPGERCPHVQVGADAGNEEQRRA